MTPLRVILSSAREEVGNERSDCTVSFELERFHTSFKCA